MADSENAREVNSGSIASRPISRRRMLENAIAGGVVAAGSTIVAPTVWRHAFAQTKAFRIGSLQPLSGGAAAGGKTALVGVQMAVDRINKSGGINGRPIELIVAGLLWSS